MKYVAVVTRNMPIFIVIQITNTILKFFGLLTETAPSKMVPLAASIGSAVVK